MNHNTQNDKIEAIDSETLVGGIDIGSEYHFIRFFTDRKIELSKKPFKFENNQEGFDQIIGLIEDLKAKYHKKDVYLGMEPTGHYWFNLMIALEFKGYHVVIVNPMHVKKSKELDDNSPAKNDRKDPKVIAGLVIEGRYQKPYLPDGVYAELRSFNILIENATEEMTCKKNQIARWFAIYFPNFKDAFSDYTRKSAMLILKVAPLPADILKLGEEGVNKIWREAKLRGVGMKKAKELVEAAKCTVGMQRAPKSATLEIRHLIEDFECLSERRMELETEAAELLKQVPNADKLQEIKGVGFKTTLGFVAEIGDLTRFDNAKQIQKLAGLSIVNDESCKHVGEHHISHRGRKRLRYTMYLAGVSVIAHNEAFAEIYQHLITRSENPLKKMQAVIAVSCKLIRIFYGVLAHGITFDENKMLRDITWYGKDAA
ncbi:MAG: IS110 family transposase [Lachnospiraceae bacterium]|nr:IS110 family transposase [Lachnospiraceae bacterium]MCH4033367.1 IS110 family transposase [Lachnospiraceae bacterium]MCI1397825.1 IS110 family transposase [Lachnospiraceae bacterium]